MKNENVKVKIKPGPVTPMQKHAWVNFWQRLLAISKEKEGQNNGRYKQTEFSG